MNVSHIAFQYTVCGKTAVVGEGFQGREAEPVQQVGLMKGMSGGHFIPNPCVAKGGRRPRLHKKAHSPLANGLLCGKARIEMERFGFVE